jgi:uncharacterized protein with HEPN domain
MRAKQVYIDYLNDVVENAEKALEFVRGMGMIFFKMRRQSLQ